MKWREKLLLVVGVSERRVAIFVVEVGCCDEKEGKLGDGHPFYSWMVVGSLLVSLFCRAIDRLL
jgi:hypothetical protein